MDTIVATVELRARLAEGEDIRLVDVRTAAEFEAGHIPASYHVPLEALREHRDEFRYIDAPMALVCQSGNRAARAAERLTSTGFDSVSILDGGIARWIPTGGPVTLGRQRWQLERQVRLAPDRGPGGGRGRPRCAATGAGSRGRVDR